MPIQIMQSIHQLRKCCCCANVQALEHPGTLDRSRNKTCGKLLFAEVRALSGMFVTGFVCLCSPCRVLLILLGLGECCFMCLLRLTPLLTSAFSRHS